MERGQQHRESSGRDGAGSSARRASGPVAYVCADCERRYALVPGGGEPLRCACGGELEKEALAPGLYEIEEARPASTKRGMTPPKGSEDAREADLGYNESHGYGPAHGGPTGPGDAPAPADGESAAKAPKAEDDDDVTVRGDA